MATEINQVYASHKLQSSSAAASVGRFLWHFLQMVVAMELGMMLYHHLLWPVLAQTPYGDLTNAYPIIGYWGMVISMALGMLALMLFHRSTGRYCFEMTAAMLAPVVALTVLMLCSVIPGHILYVAGDPLMFVAMAAYMLYRPHEHAHGAHQHPALSREEQHEKACHAE